MRRYGMLIMMFFTSLGWAADKDGNYAIWGTGNKSCHSYNLARASAADNQFKDYLMGYFTAYNHLSEETYSISSQMTLDEVLTEVGEQCELKPTVSFEEALTTFILEHHEQRMKFPPGGFGR